MLLPCVFCRQGKRRRLVGKGTSPRSQKYLHGRSEKTDDGGRVANVKDAVERSSGLTEAVDADADATSVGTGMATAAEKLRNMSESQLRNLLDDEQAFKEWYVEHILAVSTVAWGTHANSIKDGESHKNNNSAKEEIHTDEEKLRTLHAELAELKGIMQGKIDEFRMALNNAGDKYSPAEIRRGIRMWNPKGKVKGESHQKGVTRGGRLRLSPRTRDLTGLKAKMKTKGTIISDITVSKRDASHNHSNSGERKDAGILARLVEDMDVEIIVFLGRDDGGASARRRYATIIGLDELYDPVLDKICSPRGGKKGMRRRSSSKCNFDRDNRAVIGNAARAALAPVQRTLSKNHAAAMDRVLDRGDYDVYFREQQEGVGGEGQAREYLLADHNAWRYYRHCVRRGNNPRLIVQLPSLNELLKDDTEDEDEESGERKTESWPSDETNDTEITPTTPVDGPTSTDEESYYEATSSGMEPTRITAVETQMATEFQPHYEAALIEMETVSISLGSEESSSEGPIHCSGGSNDTVATNGGKSATRKTSDVSSGENTGDVSTASLSRITKGTKGSKFGRSIASIISASLSMQKKLTVLVDVDESKKPPLTTSLLTCKSPSSSPLHKNLGSSSVSLLPGLLPSAPTNTESVPSNFEKIAASPTREISTPSENNEKQVESEIRKDNAGKIDGHMSSSESATKSFHSNMLDSISEDSLSDIVNVERKKIHRVVSSQGGVEVSTDKLEYGQKKPREQYSVVVVDKDDKTQNKDNLEKRDGGINVVGVEQKGKQHEEHEDPFKLVRYDGWASLRGKGTGGAFVGGKTSWFRIIGTSANDAHSQPHVLSPALMESLRNYLPFSLSEHNFWLKYSLVRDGASYETLLSKVRGSSKTIVAIETMEGEVFGSFTSSPWRVQRDFFGNGQAFLWRLQRSRLVQSQCIGNVTRLDREVDVYPYTHADNYIQFCYQDRMAVGGGQWPPRSCPYPEETGGLGLVVEEDLTHGSSSTCATFSNPGLSAFSKNGAKFEISNLEIWTLTPFTNEEDAEKSEKRKLLMEKHTYQG